MICFDPAELEAKVQHVEHPKEEHACQSHSDHSEDIEERHGGRGIHDIPGSE